MCYSNKKKLSKKKIKDISKRLYNEAKRKIIKLEDKKINNIYITKKTEESLNNISRLSHQRSNMNNINYFKKPKKMTNSEFVANYIMHDSLIDSVAVHDKGTRVVLIIDFAFWMQNGCNRSCGRKNAG